MLFLEYEEYGKGFSTIRRLFFLVYGLYSMFLYISFYVLDKSTIQNVSPNHELSIWVFYTYLMFF